MLIKLLQDGVALNPNSSYWSIESLTLMYFSCAQQAHKLNETGIKTLQINNQQGFS